MTSVPPSERAEELIIACDMLGNPQQPRSRDLVLEEMATYSRRTGDCDIAVPVVYLVLYNGKRQLYVVRRSDKKDENPGLYDKTVGGHCNYGENFDQTLRRETREETGIEVTVTSDEDFVDVRQSANLREKAVVRRIAFDPWCPSLRKMRTGTPWVKRVRVAIYAGQYEGDVSFKDREAVELNLWTPEQLAKEIRQNRNRFTKDIVEILGRYATQIIR